ncbi:uncharacterized protein B0T15DRAFT_192636 [Chaetomium strumarium]|uniref:Uncharacterized protein n=1 Tax=Chaetomium strumarium TaxID=1170767 RepID=A0AAJ0GSF9_9PEZI|nr:hypothetical protein B0T15DRAFT_192636 [Chaetomium strumarium]
MPRIGPRHSVSAPTPTHLAGQIMWLPSVMDVDESDRVQSIHPDAYNHPVVILSPGLRAGKVEIFILTSLDDTDLAVKFARNNPRRRQYVPISPCNPHPDNQRLLYLDEEATLPKMTYVNIEKHHTITFHVLRPYDRRDHHHSSSSVYILTRGSYQDLVEYASVVSVVPVPVPSPLPVAVENPTPALQYRQQQQQKQQQQQQTATTPLIPVPSQPASSEYLDYGTCATAPPAQPPTTVRTHTGTSSNATPNLLPTGPTRTVYQDLPSYHHHTDYQYPRTYSEWSQAQTGTTRTGTGSTSSNTSTTVNRPRPKARETTPLLLPRYHPHPHPLSQPTYRSSSRRWNSPFIRASSGGGTDGPTTPTPRKYILCGFALGLLLLGVQVGWVHRAEVARALLAAGKWVAVNAWWLLRGIAVMLGRGVAWIARSVWGVVVKGKGGGAGMLMLWRWVGGG